MTQHFDSAGDELRYGVFWVTDRIAIGRFASPERARFLQEIGITHVLNVSDATSVISPHDFHFDAIFDSPVADLDFIPVELAKQCCDIIDSSLTAAP